MEAQELPDGRGRVKKYLILGGGTAGAVAALYLEMITSHRPNEREITLVKSEDIGIIGAGEGTTPQFVDLMRHLDISFTRLARETNATIKNGIRFTNWRGGGDYEKYMHPFFTHSGIGINNMHSEYQILTYPGAFAKNYEASESSDKSDLTTMAAKSGKVLFSQVAAELADPTDDPLTLFRALSDYAIHFDAQVLADYLLGVAEARGVKVVEGKVEDFTQAKTGDVTNVYLEDGKNIETDFIFDASGMARFFAKKLDCEWVSWKESLKTDSAISFILPPQKKLPAHTDAIAMKNGWMWQIPLQHRTGCGYVYDSSYMSAEEAKEEVEQYLGRKIEIQQSFKFEPGYYKDPWKNNVISIGLAGSFVEPLEATSLWSTVLQLEFVMTRPESMVDTSQKDRDYYNHRFADMQENIASLIYFHYMGRNTEEGFWGQFTEDKAPLKLKKLLEIMKWKTIEPFDMPNSLWAVDSWYYVAMGIKYGPLLDSIKRSVKENIYMVTSDQDYLILKKQQVEVAQNVLLGHRDFLEKLGVTPWSELENG